LLNNPRSNFKVGNFLLGYQVIGVSGFEDWEIGILGIGFVAEYPDILISKSRFPNIPIYL
jgi:hypothetical protein